MILIIPGRVSPSCQRDPTRNTPSGNGRNDVMNGAWGIPAVSKGHQTQAFFEPLKPELEVSAETRRDQPPERNRTPSITNG